MNKLEIIAILVGAISFALALSVFIKKDKPKYYYLPKYRHDDNIIHWQTHGKYEYVKEKGGTTLANVNTRLYNEVIEAKNNQTIKRK